MVLKIISFVSNPSSFFVKKREIIGDVLNNVQPIPKGRD
tara:strand:+ start:206 stop:322 length:117 start_codon:yes stop_codon:yes gene_type:complete